MCPGKCACGCSHGVNSDQFSDVREGDKVRVEFKDGAMEGTFKGDRTITIAGDPEGLAWWQFALRDKVQVTVLRRALPPEPPKKTVVIDEHGWAWQNTGSGRWGNADGFALTWEELNTHAPVRIAYTPGAEL